MTQQTTEVDGREAPTLGEDEKQNAEQSRGSTTETDNSDKPNQEEEEIKSVKQELAAVKDKYLRTLADNENQKKRWEKEKRELLNYGSEKLFSNLLPVLDSFEKALETLQDSEGSKQNDSMLEGVKLVHKQLIDTLELGGLEKIKSKGQPFDPNFHQAIQKLESEDTKVEVVFEEFQAGYALKGRLLRPSMVSVKTPKDSTGEQS